MKTIENKATSIAKSENVSATYGDLIASLLNRPLSKTVDLKSMRRDLRLLDLFDSGAATFEVSGEDLTYIANLVENSEWAFKHKDIVEFADYFQSIANS